MGARSGYFAEMKAEVRRLLDDISGPISVARSESRFLADAGLSLSPEQAEALRSLTDSSERAAALLRELQGVLL